MNRKTHKKVNHNALDDDLISEFSNDPKKYKQNPGQLPVLDLEGDDPNEIIQRSSLKQEYKKNNFFLDKTQVQKSISTDFSSVYSRNNNFQIPPSMFLNNNPNIDINNPNPVEVNTSNHNVNNPLIIHNNINNPSLPPPQDNNHFERNPTPFFQSRGSDDIRRDIIRRGSSGDFDVLARRPSYFERKEIALTENYGFRRRKSFLSTDSELPSGPVFSLPVDPKVFSGKTSRGVLAPKPQFIFPEVSRPINTANPTQFKDDEDLLKDLENHQVVDILSQSMRYPHLGMAIVTCLWALLYYFMDLPSCAAGLIPAISAEILHWFYTNEHWSPATNSHMLTGSYLLSLSVNVYYTGGYKSPLSPAFLVLPHFFTPATADFHTFISLWSAAISALFIGFYMMHDESLDHGENILSPSSDKIFRISCLISTTIFWLFIGSTRSGVLKEALKTSELAQNLAQKSNRMKSNFLANMSHELRTPLTGICGFADLLQHTDDLDLAEIESLRLIQLSANSVINTISGILDYSKLEEGSFSVENVPLDICKTIEEALETCCYVLSNNTNVELFGTLPKQLHDLKLRGDPIRIGQCLINLVSNALKFTDSGKVELKVCIGKKTQETVELVFEISDTGLGISEEDQKRLFSAFQQAPNSRRKAGGTGLGLTITKSLVEKMNGRITLESQVGKGTTFKFNVILENSVKEVPEPQPLAHQEVCQSVLILGSHPLLHQAFLKFFHVYFPKVHVHSYTGPLEQFYGHFQNTSISVDLIISHASNVLHYYDSILEIARRKMKFPRIMLFVMIKSSLEHFFRENHPVILYLCPKPVVFSYRLAQTISRTCSRSEPDRRILLSSARRFSMDVPQNSQLVEITPPSPKDITGLSVLLVEDNIFNQRLFSQFLDRLGAKFFLASNGQEALEFLHNTEERIDLVLTDLWMPLIDGVAMTNTLRKMPKYEKTPVVGITADTQFDFKGSCPFDKLLFKPIQLLTLKAALNEVLSETK